MLKGWIQPSNRKETGCALVDSSAAKISYGHKLPMVDSHIMPRQEYITPIAWTQDGHFKSLDGVKYFDKG